MYNIAEKHQLMQFHAFMILIRTNMYIRGD